MMTLLYNQLLEDLTGNNKKSLIFKHHINYINESHYKRTTPYIETEPNQIVVDYIASMTDDYFIDLFNLLFPNSKYNLTYKGYFK